MPWCVLAPCEFFNRFISTHPRVYQIGNLDDFPVVFSVLDHLMPQVSRDPGTCKIKVFLQGPS